MPTIHAGANVAARKHCHAQDNCPRQAVPCNNTGDRGPRRKDKRGIGKICPRLTSRMARNATQSEEIGELMFHSALTRTTTMVCPLLFPLDGLRNTTSPY